MQDRSLVIEVAWGWCGLRRSEAGLTRSTLPVPSRDAAWRPVSEGAPWDGEDALLCAAGDLFGAYFRGERLDFGLPLDMRRLGRFAQDILSACAQIPYGQTRSYGEVAALAGAPGAARAAGQALARNPLPILVPCHRVIGADGRLVGFGAGLEMKRRLLALERDGR
jgi:methylated-DNA-[protein]-cysteine S-methyltransferase